MLLKMLQVETELPPINMSSSEINSASGSWCMPLYYIIMQQFIFFSMSFKFKLRFSKKFSHFCYTVQLVK